MKMISTQKIFSTHMFLSSDVPAVLVVFRRAVIHNILRGGGYCDSRITSSVYTISHRRTRIAGRIPRCASFFCSLVPVSVSEVCAELCASYFFPPADDAAHCVQEMIPSSSEQTECAPKNFLSTYADESSAPNVFLSSGTDKSFTQHKFPSSGGSGKYAPDGFSSRHDIYRLLARRKYEAD